MEAVRVAVIPARGGSKRIPRKNIREFAGKPMLAYSVACALESRLFEQVIVSTDDEEIASVARGLGATVPFKRPKDLSDDHTGTISVVAHAISQLHGLDAQLSAVCCIYPTAPFIRQDDVKRGLAILERGNWRYVFSAATFAFPVFRSFQAMPDGGVKMLFPEHFETRSQDLPEVLQDAGQFYWGRPEAWLAGTRMFEPWSTIVRIPRWRVQDMDTEEDWQRAELMSAYINSHL